MGILGHLGLEVSPLGVGKVRVVIGNFHRFTGATRRNTIQPPNKIKRFLYSSDKLSGGNPIVLWFHFKRVAHLLLPLLEVPE